MNLIETLENASSKYSLKTAIVSGSRRISYKELDEDSNRVAHYLIEKGLDKDDRVAILLPNSLEYVVLFFGILKAGGIAVPLDIKYKDFEIQSFFGSCQPAMVIGETAYLKPLMPIFSGFSYLRHIIDIEADSATGYRQITEFGSVEEVDIAKEPEDTAIIAYTSGPAYEPHGVVLTHRNLAAEAMISANGFRQTDKDVSILFALPLHHVFGLVGILLTAVCTGSTIIIVPGLSLSGVLETIAREKVTMFMGVPYVYNLLINMAQNDGITYDLSSIRIWGSSGAPLSKSISSNFGKLFGSALVNFWGLSEATCHITCPPLPCPEVNGSVGKALPGWEIKIVDDEGKTLAENQDGEIAVRGMPVMQGYYHNLPETGKVLKDGWLYTGDIGRIDSCGYLFITGRKRNMVIRKGQNIYPGDIEFLLKKHKQIAEVVVAGIQDDIRGEEVKAIIIPVRDAVITEQEIRQFCLEHLANYKVPRQITIIDDMPRDASGNIDRETLKNIRPRV